MLLFPHESMQFNFIFKFLTAKLFRVSLFKIYFWTLILSFFLIKLSLILKILFLIALKHCVIFCILQYILLFPGQLLSIWHKIVLILKNSDFLLTEIHCCSVAQLCLFLIPWTAECQASLSFTIFLNLPKLCPLSQWSHLSKVKRN